MAVRYGDMYLSSSTTDGRKDLLRTQTLLVSVIVVVVVVVVVVVAILVVSLLHLCYRSIIHIAIAIGEVSIMPLLRCCLPFSLS